MSIVLDAIVALVLALMVYIGIKRGFIKTAVRLIGVIAAVVGAAILSGFLTTLLYESLLMQPLEEMVQKRVNQGVAASATTLAEQVENVMDSMSVLGGLFTQDMLADIPNMAAAAGETVTTTVMDYVIEPVFVVVIQSVLFLLLFIVLCLIVKLLAAALDNLFGKLPVIKQVNVLFGAALGLVEGVLIVMVLCCVLEIYLAIAGSSSIISSEMIDNTVLLDTAMSINPIV